MGKRYRSGFTLLELLIVLIILGVLLSIAVSSFREYQQKTRLRSAIETIGMQFRQVRWDARLKSEKQSITFDVEGRSYAVNGATVGHLPPGIWFGTDPKVTAKPGQPYSTPPTDGISFDMGKSKNAFRLYPLGNVSPTGTVFITDGKETVALTVAITGRPKLWRSCGGWKWESF